MTHAILTAIGNDRPGLVDEVSQFIFDHGGNIEDSRMVNLRGQFAMMVLVGAPEAGFDRVRQDLTTLASRSGLHVDLRPAASAPLQAGAAPGGAVPFRLTGSGLDQPGLVHRVAHLLRSLNVNIESMDTHLTAAPYTGAPLFEMELILAIPRSTPIGQLRQKLGALCDEMNIDSRLEAV